MDQDSDQINELQGASASILFDALLSQTQDQVYFKDRESRFVRISEAVAEKFGCDSVNDLIGKSDADFFAEEHAAATFEGEQWLMLNNEKLVNITEKEVWPDGTVTWATTTKIPLVLGSGNVVGLMGITRDITDRVKAEQELEASRQLLKRKNDVMETDLANARRIQKRLIPGPIPQLPFVEIAVLNLSMTEVCGDVVSFPTASKDSLAFLLGDVAGHGVTAGLFTILVKHLADFLLPDDFEYLEDAIIKLDTHLQGLIPSGYVAILLGTLRPIQKTGGVRLHVANAGQPSALWYRKSRQLIEAADLPSENVVGLGICEKAECVDFDLEPGDCFIFVSDGVVECRNRRGDELGLKGLEKAMASFAHEAPQLIINKLRAFLVDYSGGDFPQDDTTILALRIK